MKLTNEVWGKVLKLKSKYEKESKMLSRDKLTAELQGVCSEHNARVLHEMLQNLHILLKHTGAASEARLLDKLASLNSKNKELRDELGRLNKVVDLVNNVSKQEADSPEWLINKTQTKNKAMACAMLSDTHFDEVVDPEQINGINAYNREIATQRVQTYFQSLIKLRNSYFTGIEIEGLVLMLAGDMVSGVIHEELQATNDFPIADTLVYYSELLAAGIRLITNVYGSVYVPCVVGNHGRMSQKLKFKNAVRDNFDYLFYKMTASALKNDSRITFSISESPDKLVKVYDTEFLLTHGNQFRGGSGWSGPLLPVIKGDTKKRDRQSAIDQPYDVLCCGHFHTQKFLGNQIMAGSICGYNEFADAGNFGYEPPQQPFWLVDPKHGVTITAPIHCG